jgi:hypothetical protein
MGAQLLVCNPGRTGFVLSDTCASAALCDEMNGMCLAAPACAVGQKKCQGAWLQVCNADRSGYENLMQCANANLCDDENGECDDCVAPAFQCTADSKLQQCDASGHWALLQDCSLTSATCDASAGTCVAPPPP